ncbi:hypothetical protein GCM10008119_00890 [Pedobacter mendelii]|uniref:Glycoside hydrolase 123-like N-terminal domain-containing protein n=1 Tax=Pedobacter mendelii TaxID=1908240 RepID=A0ABQ2BER7_9SPHI|nr:hypothetical protein GCM10008119_00890 [Pedobacter mendelii]
MVALASWDESDTKINLAIDWNKLGITADKAKISAPNIDKFQSAGNYSDGKSILVEKGKGLILIIE